MKKRVYGTTQRGSVFILFALLIVAIVTIVGLAFDSFLATGNDSTQQNVAEYVALAALKGFKDAQPGLAPGTDDGTRFRSGMDLGIAKAQDILNDNKQLKVRARGSFGASITEGNGVGMYPENSDVSITYGKWFFEEPKGGCGAFTNPDEDTALNVSGCPCAGGWKGQCFAPNRVGAPRGNAVKAVVVSRDANTIDRTLPVSDSTKTGSSLTSTGIAVALPRNLVFAFDLAGSMFSVSHRVPTDDRWKFAFPMEGGLVEASDVGNYHSATDYFVRPSYIDRCGSTTGAPSPCVQSTTSTEVLDYFNLLNAYNNYTGDPALRPQQPIDPRDPTRNCDFEDENTQKMWADNYNYAGTYRTGGGTFYRSDYLCFDIDYTDEQSKDGQQSYGPDRQTYPQRSESYQIDGFNRPQPLFDALLAVNEGLNVMEKQAFAEDTVGFLGFDYSAEVGKRRIDMSSPIAGVTNFEEFKDMTNVLQGDLPSKLMEHLLVPRLVANVNIRDGLLKAGEMLSTVTDDQGVAINHIVLVTDGLNGCSPDVTSPLKCNHAKDNYLYSATGYKQYNPPTGTGMLGASIPSAVNYLAQEKVRLHVVLTPTKQVKPHEILRASIDNPGKCMSQGEAAGHKLPFTDSGEINDTTMADYEAYRVFHHPSEMAKYAYQTGGNFLPLRPSCCAMAGACDAAALKQIMEDACEAKHTQLFAAGPTALADPDQNIVTLAPYTDSEGRFFCDPDNRTFAQQLSGFISGILSDTPFRLAASKDEIQ